LPTTQHNEPKSIDKPGDPKPGDLVCIDSFRSGIGFSGTCLLTLGEERDCQFLTTPHEEGRLLLKTGDGTTKVVAVLVWSEMSGPWEDQRRPTSILWPSYLIPK